MTDRAALLDYADAVLDGKVALGARGPRTAAVLARLAFEDWLNEASTWLSASQDRPTTNSKLVVLSAFRGVELGEQAKRVWHALSRACHHHAYELQPPWPRSNAWLRPCASWMPSCARLSEEWAWFPRSNDDAPGKGDASIDNGRQAMVCARYLMVSFAYRFSKSCPRRFAPGLSFRFSCVAMSEMDRRRMMLMTGMGVLAAAAIPLPKAGAHPSRPDVPTDRVSPPAAPPGNYIFQDEFNGPAGSAPDPSKWTVSKARESMKDPTFWEMPENVGQYRDDRRNVFLDGNSILVIKAFKEGNTYYGGKVFSPQEIGIGHTWEARIKLDCLTAGCWPAYWLSSDAQGEIDIVEWYGNGSWPSATTVHARANGSEWKTHNIALDSAWHTWRVQWDDAGMRFWRDYTEGAQPYFTVPANSLEDWPFNDPGYRVFPILNLAVAGSGGGDPGPGTYPAQMLVDWVRIW